MRSDEIGQRVKQLRAAAGLTQLQLAGRAQVDTTMLSRVERGEVVPSIDWLEKVAHGLGVGLVLELVPPAPAQAPARPPERVERLEDRAAWVAAVNAASARRAAHGMPADAPTLELAYAASFSDGAAGADLESQASDVLARLSAGPRPDARVSPRGTMQGGTPLKRKR